MSLKHSLMFPRPRLITGLKLDLTHKGPHSADPCWETECIRWKGPRLSAPSSPCLGGFQKGVGGHFLWGLIWLDSLKYMHSWDTLFMLCLAKRENFLRTYFPGLKSPCGDCSKHPYHLTCLADPPSERTTGSSG